MIVPQFWAEGRAQHRQNNKQTTVRRFGWSDSSAAEAQSSADARAQEALQRILSGEKLLRREPKIPYNGAQGVPIREEIIDRHGETVITRNSYGARCLNTPNVLFADIDFDRSTPKRYVFATIGVLLTLAIATGALMHSAHIGFTLGMFALFFSSLIVKSAMRLARLLQGGAEAVEKKRLRRFWQTIQLGMCVFTRPPPGFGCWRCTKPSNLTILRSKPVSTHWRLIRFTPSCAETNGAFALASARNRGVSALPRTCARDRGCGQWRRNGWQCANLGLMPTKMQQENSLRASSWKP